MLTSFPVGGTVILFSSFTAITNGFLQKAVFFIQIFPLSTQSLHSSNDVLMLKYDSIQILKSSKNEWKIFEIETKLLVSGRNPECSDCLLKSMKQLENGKKRNKVIRFFSFFL